MAAGFMLGLVGVGVFIIGYVWWAASGLPTERRRTAEKRAAIALEMQERDIQAEADRQLRIEQAKQAILDREAN